MLPFAIVSHFLTAFKGKEKRIKLYKKWKKKLISNNEQRKEVLSCTKWNFFSSFYSSPSQLITRALIIYKASVDHFLVSNRKKEDEYFAILLK